MRSELLSLYHAMPAPLRSMAASVRGWQLKQWRYGRDTEALVKAALERDTWSPHQWRNWQERQLALLLHRAATQVPYYRSMWAERRRRGDLRSWDVLENWPVLEKNTVRQNSIAFVADDCHPRSMFHEHTSGTTGQPLNLWWSRATVRAWYALFEARCRRWFGLSLDDRWAIVGGQLVTPFAQRKPPFWVWNCALKQLYCSSYHLASDLAPYYLEAFEKYRIRYLLGYPSALTALGTAARQRGQRVAMSVVITNAEPVYPEQRSVLQDAFSCPVIETYGMAEIAAGASQCLHGSLHAWPEVGWADYISNGYGDSARQLECTGLLNTDMPLIRYRVGDLAEPAGNQPACACGRGLPHFGRVYGRSDDVLFTTDGRAIGRLDPVFKADLPVCEAQIVQEDYDRVRILLVPAAGYTTKAGHHLVERVQQRMGPVKVMLEPVSQIPRGANGKFRAVVCRIPVRQPEVQRHVM